MRKRLISYGEYQLYIIQIDIKDLIQLFFISNNF
jgi:hypothetical protein